MKWKNCRTLMLLCYFVAFICFSSAAFLPQVLELSKASSGYTEELKDLKAIVRQPIAQTDTKKKPKKIKPASSVCDKYGALE